jgi:hypothetical protein
MLFEKLSFIELLNSNDRLKAFDVTGSWCIYVDKRQSSLSFYPIQSEC